MDDKEVILQSTMFSVNNTRVEETFTIGPVGNMKQFSYNIKFTKYPIGNVLKDEMDEWCKENCNGDHYSGLYVFWFMDVQDAMAFKLRWI